MLPVIYRPLRAITLLVLATITGQAQSPELVVQTGHTGYIMTVAFSPDGKMLASGSLDHTIKLWDVSTGTELSSLKGHTSPVNCAAFSPDGKTLASSTLSTVQLWDVSTGAELRTFKGESYYYWVTSVAFSPDGKTIASNSFDVVKTWDVFTGKELWTLTGHSKAVDSLAFSPDRKTLASGSDDNTIKLWDLSTGAKLRTLEGHSRPVNSVAVSPDGNTIASGSGGKIKLWSLSADLQTLKGDAFWCNSVTFGARNTLASGSNSGKIKLWDVLTGLELHTLNGQFYSLRSVVFSPDGKTLAIGIGDSTPGAGGGTIKLWDVATDTELRTLKGHIYTVEKVAFSPDGKTLASGSWDHTVRLWDVATGAELHTLKGHSREVEPVAFSPDGKILASGSWDQTVKLWDVSTGTLLHTLEGHSKSVESVAFSPDGKTLGSGSDTLKLWDVSTGAELRTLTGHAREVRSVAFSPNGKYLVSGSEDKTIKIWEVTCGKELATLIAFDEKEWIIVTPDGLFDGSPLSWNKIVWRFSNNTFDYAPVEAYFGDFYYPGLLNDILGGKDPKAPSDISKKDRRLTHLNLMLADTRLDETITARILKVKIDVSQAPAGAQDVRLFRNGSLVKVWHGDVLQGQSAVTLEATIPVVAGENRLTAYAFNRDNIKSPDAQLTVTGADSLKRAAMAYIVAIGVNVYANLRYNLRYAVADSQAFAEEIRRQQSKLGQYADIKVISLTDKDATKLKILDALKALRSQVQPEDALLIYFAGHGTAQHNRFYLIPHDLGYAGPRTALNKAGLQSILSHSISDLELQQAVEGIDAGRILLVVDACNSGQALEAEEKRRGPMNSKGLAQLAYEKGMYILTAAQSYQAAQEASRLGHGFLTYALVEEGLKSDVADKSPKDGQVLLREWLDFATARVPQMQLEKVAEQKKQGRLLEQIIVFAEGDSGRDRRVQRPRVFYRREAETSPLVVARP